MMDEQKRELAFLSYAHDDLEMVYKVYEGLKKRKVAVGFDKPGFTFQGMPGNKIAVKRADGYTMFYNGVPF